MKTIKITEASDLALDYLVAKCLGYSHYENDAVDGKVFRKTPGGFAVDFRIEDNSFCNDWGLGGPIIECIKGFTFKQWLESKPESCCEAHIHNYEGDWIQFGPTPLIAVMRCFIVSKLGDTVEIPDHL